MADGTLAGILLDLAHQDVLAYRKLRDDPDIKDALVGFHAQHAIEKSLKAVLSHAGIVFRRTHDIAELLDLMADASLSAPPHADRLDELNPYAVEMRYGLIEPGGLDRAETRRFIEDVLVWAKAEVDRP